MKIQEAIQKVTEAGFAATLWEKGGKQRIYVDFMFKGSKRTGGFIGSDRTELKAAPCGRHTAKYQARLDEIAGLEIEWMTQEKNDGSEAYTESYKNESWYKIHQL